MKYIKNNACIHKNLRYPAHNHKSLANPPSVSLPVFRPWSGGDVKAPSLRLQVLTPPSYHGLQTVKELQEHKQTLTPYGAAFNV